MFYTLPYQGLDIYIYTVLIGRVCVCVCVWCRRRKDDRSLEDPHGPRAARQRSGHDDDGELYESRLLIHRRPHLSPSDTGIRWESDDGRGSVMSSGLGFSLSLFHLVPSFLEDECSRPFPPLFYLFLF